MPNYKSVVILTGAGISAESGISTFRDPDGIWAKYDVEEVATPEGFARNPTLVHDFYNMRREALKAVKPNAGHLALARLEAELTKRGDVDFMLITQNVDNLHEAAGSQKLVHMHGQLMQAWCKACDTRHAWAADMSTETFCPQCRAAGSMRPDVVWFGEMPYQMDRLYDAISGCDLFISVGTSGNVHPAASFVSGARAVGAHTVELNLEPSVGVTQFRQAVHGRGTEIIPAFVEQVLEQYA
jgi:NAD-dependent deacetylase